MAPHLPDHPWRISYSSNEHNPILDFYIPALECAQQYDRKAGFFNSAILSKVARGLGAMLENQGKIRLIMGCQFSPQDLQAIEAGYQLREALVFRLDQELTPPTNLAQLKHFEILSWLIQNQYLDIRIAIPLHQNGVPEAPALQLDTRHIFHEKVGIFTDAEGNQLAFSGSNNESLSGWEQNVESFHVYCSWDGARDLERVTEEQFRFDQLWHNLAPNVQSFEVPEAIEKKLLRYLPETRPSWNPQAEFNFQPVPLSPEIQPSLNHPWVEQTSKISPHKESELKNPENDTPGTLSIPSINDENTEAIPIPPEPLDLAFEQAKFQPLQHLANHPGCLDYCLKSIPIKPWPHQLKILRKVAYNFPCNVLIADEVGLGKTIETGLILRYLLVSQKVKRVLILVPASVQAQWHEELREKFNLHFWSYSQGNFQSPYQEKSTPAQNLWNTHDLILASSHLGRRQEQTQALLAAEPWDLVIVDEAHHARRQSPQNRQDLPNRLLQLLRQLTHHTQALILLSATPMQIDVVEVFDLLAALGLPGTWSFMDNFCDYFTFLSEPPTPQILEFWQKMSQDYFTTGGKPCGRWQQYLQKQDRRLYYQLEDSWARGTPFINPKQTLLDQRFMDASRQFLTLNTPLKDLMFRHTRDTLREYYKRGLLERDIPTRVVQDNTIALEPLREVPLYRAVSDYVRHFYNLAQAEKRRGLGFLMTLYRKRLTSSFFAIQESLKRRLDGIRLNLDDAADLEDTDDPIIDELEAYLRAPDPEEINYLETLLKQFENTGEDSKLSHCIQQLRQELNTRESAIIFTQYTDTMDYLREALKPLYGAQMGCYSGRGGELFQDEQWCLVPKEQIKRLFREGMIKILLCTESASEGLNLQTCGVLINYDMPWNPMRVEQRIGRLDRIGQRYSTVHIHNFYYDGTVEAKVYSRLRSRINAFQTVVGNLQPILAQVPTFIEKAAMSADPEEEGVLFAELETVLNTPPLKPALDEMIALNVESDLREIEQPLVPAPVTPETLEELFTQSQLLRHQGIEFMPLENRIWEIRGFGAPYQVTFYPDVFDESPSLRFMALGEPLLDKLLNLVLHPLAATLPSSS